MGQVEIDEARAVVTSHEEYSRSGDLDGVVSNAAEDIVMFAPDTPLIQGKDAFRSFYESLLGMGRWDFRHEYHGGEVSGDTVFLHGVARGTITPPAGDAAPFANNFFLVLKRVDGKFKVWRAAFAPAAPE